MGSASSLANVAVWPRGASAGRPRTDLIRKPQPGVKRHAGGRRTIGKTLGPLHGCLHRKGSNDRAWSYGAPSWRRGLAVAEWNSPTPQNVIPAHVPCGGGGALDMSRKASAGRHHWCSFTGRLGDAPNIWVAACGNTAHGARVVVFTNCRKFGRFVLRHEPAITPDRKENRNLLELDVIIQRVNRFDSMG